jgi:hypothetical protein
MYYIKLLKTVYINRAANGYRQRQLEGTPIATVMPSEYDIAVETFVNPLDLLVKGEKIRIWMVGQYFLAGQICPYGTLEVKL